MNSGSAASRPDVVHCIAAHTSAAFTRPAITALIGNQHGTDVRGQQQRGGHRTEHAVDGEQNKNDDPHHRVATMVVDQVGMLSSNADQRTHHPLEIVQAVLPVLQVGVQIRVHSRPFRCAA